MGTDLSLISDISKQAEDFPQAAVKLVNLFLTEVSFNVVRWLSVYIATDMGRVKFSSMKCTGRTTVESREYGCVSLWASCRQVYSGFWHSRNESRGPACHNGSAKRVRFECLRGGSRYQALMLDIRAEGRYRCGRRISVPTFRTRQLSHYGHVSSMRSFTAREMTDSWSDVNVGIWRRRLQPVVAVPGSLHSGTRPGGERDGGSWVRRPAASGEMESAPLLWMWNGRCQRWPAMSMQGTRECASEGSGPGGPGREPLHQH